jgi:hypothetical protein
MEDFTMKRTMHECSRYCSRVARSRVAGAVLGMLALAGCASAPEAPTDSLRAAEMAIAHAEQARVADYAAPELGAARQLLSAARDAVLDEEMALAWRLAEQSRANAELAYAKAEAAKAAAINAEMQKSIDALKQEMQRHSGGRR